MSMSDQPDHIKREYDLYALERDRMELEQLRIEQERREQDREDLIMADVEQQELDEDDQRWDAAWEAWLDELAANEQIERAHDEDDQRRNDR